LEKEASNLDAAIDHLVEYKPIEALELVANLERFFTIRGTVDVLTPVLRAVSRVDHDAPGNAEIVAAGLVAACVITSWYQLGQRDWTTAGFKYAKRAEELAARVWRTDLETRVLTCEITLALALGDAASAVQYAERAEAAARQCGDNALLCDALVTALHPLITKRRGLTTKGIWAIADEAMDAASESNDPVMIVRAKFWYATLAIQHNQLDKARRLLEETLELSVEIGAHDGAALNNYLIVCLSQDDFAAAVAPLRKCLRRTRRAGFRNNPGDLIAAGACIATSRGDHLAGAQLHGAADEMRKPAYETGELFKTPADMRMELVSMERCRSALGDEQYEAAYEEGQGLSMTRACDLALGILH